jgi:hypothetical protein
VDGGAASDTGSGLAGTFGAAGEVGTGGTVGAAGTTPAACVEGTKSCADARTAAICSGGIIQGFSCPSGCFDGVCAECVPGRTACETEKTVHACGPNGIWRPARACDHICVDGACGACVEGATRCASPERQQTCKGGEWTAETECEFVCVGDRCGKDVRHVFATSQAFVGGELGGLSGADDMCRTLAINAGLVGSYFSWLSDDTGAPATRFTKDGGPYTLVDGTVVANNWTDLTAGMLRHPIDLNEMGGPPAQSPDLVTSFAVWTNTKATGVISTIYPGGGSCGQWSDRMGTTIVFGSFEFATGNWSELAGGGTDPGATPVLCTVPAALYCFEQ